MNRKIKNTLALVGILAALLVLGFAFIFIFQKPSIKKKKAELANLKAFEYDTEGLRQQLRDKTREASILDSVLAARKFNIPQGLSPLKFYEFLNNMAPMLSQECKVNVEYLEQKTDKNFFFHSYKVSGYGTYNDMYQIVYAIEQSKELKKILNITLSSYVVTTDTDEPDFLVNFTLNVGTYFADNDRFASAEYIENKLSASKLYDVFYPLIRTQIPPNYDGLLDVQGARLLALVPEGAFISDLKGESFLLMEGDKVYLGYLTQIDRQRNKAKFVLNKGGIVESIEIPLEREIQKLEK
ncbi:MAG: hypothetical protein HYV28_12820 [Ignavibacteriales bacterium]|nr:hypothetical protein [Ignavibacteriales bacterium]